MIGCFEVYLHNSIHVLYHVQPFCVPKWNHSPLLATFASRRESPLLATFAGSLRRESPLLATFASRRECSGLCSRRLPSPEHSLRLANQLRRYACKQQA